MVHRPFRHLRLRATLGVVALTLAMAASAQDLSLLTRPRTGDAWVDGRIEDIDRYGTSYRPAFVDEVVRYHGAPRELVVALLDERRWTPGDVYYACAMAAVLGRPCRFVADLRQQRLGEGWGVLAAQLGITPGTPQFQRLKRGFVASYDRWARPIVLDDALRADFPERGGNRRKR